MLSVSNSGWSENNNARGGGDISFNVFSEGTAVIEASINKTVVKTLTVHTHPGNYITGYEYSSNSKNSSRTIIRVGQDFNVKDHILNYALPVGGDFSDEEFTYEIYNDIDDSAEITGDILKTKKKCSTSINAISKTGKIYYLYVVAISEPISSFSFAQDQFSRIYDEKMDEYYNTVYMYASTTPENAINGINEDEIEVSISDSSIAEIGDRYGASIPVKFKKPGSVEVTAKYKDFTTTATSKCYVGKTPETIECPDSVKGYKGYMSYFNYSFGSDEEVDNTAVFEVIEGKDIVLVTSSGGSNNNKCPFIAKDYGEAVIRVKSAKNENIYKDVKVVVTNEPAPEPILTIMLNGKEEVPVYVSTTGSSEGNINNVVMEDGTHTFDTGSSLNLSADPKAGYHFDHWLINGQIDTNASGIHGDLDLIVNNDTSIEAVFKACDDEEVRNAVKPTCTKTGYSGDVYCKTNNVLIKKGEVLPMTEHNYVDHICKECGAKEEVPEEKPEAPVTDTIKESISEVKVEKVVESIPEAVVTVDGVEVKTTALKNDQLSGGKNIEITLPINGLDLKEIVHKSEDYPTEYIYDFVISKEGTVTFKISHFSSFTLNEVITKPAKPSTNNKPVVNTGDHTDIMLYGGVGIIAAMCAVALILFRKKHA